MLLKTYDFVEQRFQPCVKAFDFKDGFARWGTLQFRFIRDNST